MELPNPFKDMKRPSLTGEGIRSLSPPMVALAVGGGLFLVAWIGWSIYSASDRGAHAGLGVLIAWPVLLAMAAIIIAPFALIGVLIVRMTRGAGDAQADANDEDAAEDEESADDEGAADDKEAGEDDAK